MGYEVLKVITFALFERLKKGVNQAKKNANVWNEYYNYHF